MRKGACLAALCLALSLSGAALATSGEQTLISVNYLTGLYALQLEARLEERIAQRAAEEWERRLGAVQPGPSGWQEAEHFAPLYLRPHEYVLLSAGSGLLWRSGQGVTAAPLLDVTEGKELAAGSELTAGHRYLSEGGAMVVAESEAAACSVEGLYQTSATGEPSPEQPDSPPTVENFTDVKPSDWFYEPVLYVVERGLFQGTGVGVFAPHEHMNRGMLATVLHRMAGEPMGAYRGSFADVPEGTWYTPGVEWAAAMSIVNGTGADRFSPEQTITREQIAVMMYRYAAAFGFDVTGRGDLSEFSDGRLVSDYARDAMAWAVKTGILQGSGGALNPGQNASRCEVATMLMRFDRWMG